jgi:8-oxoguanine DNA glycosylase, N-terminal domain
LYSPTQDMQDMQGLQDLHRVWHEVLGGTTPHTLHLSPGSRTPSCSAWRQLGAPAEEVQLRFTLPTGQSFRWRATGADEYTGVIGQRVVGFSHLLLQPAHLV